MKRSRLGLLRALLGVLAIGVLLFVVDISVVTRALADIRAWDLVNLFALSIVLILVSVVKWRAFLERLGIVASIPHLFRLYLVGYFVNLLMPSSLGGDVVRSIYVGRDIDKVRAVSATLLERYTGFIAMVCLSGIAVWWAPQVTPQIVWLTISVACGALGLTVVMLTGKLSVVASRLRVPTRVCHKVARLEEGLRWGLSDKGLLVRAGVLSVVFHLLTIVNTAVVGYAVGCDAMPWGDLLVVVPLILLVGAIPLSPQGLGIQEGAFIFFLSSIGITSGEALAIALVLRAKSYVLALVGGVLWFGVGRQRQVDSSEHRVAPEFPPV